MDEVKNYPPYLDYPKPYKAEVSIDCVNRKAFIGEIEKHYCAPCKGQDGDLCGDWCRSCVINSVLEKVREFPAADVAAVQHGRWIEKTAHVRHSYFECSNCGAHENKHTAIKGRFCWSCGAIMDGDTQWLST